MFVDANVLCAGTVVEADVCVIGAGPAGIALAYALHGSGLSVCLLESGDLQASAAAQELSEGELSGDWTTPLPESRVRRFGGTANEWAIRLGFRRAGARYAPLSPLDFERREWLPYSGWPFSYAELMPYYRRAQRVCGLGPFAYDGEEWRTPRTPPLPLRRERVVTRVFQFGPRSRFTHRYRDALARSRRVTVYLNATALCLQTNGYGTTVTAAEVSATNGRRFSVSARAFVLAMGGIENARLLLLSHERQPAGLGNGHDLVGRFLMEHPQIGTGLLLPFAPGLARRMALYDSTLVRGVPLMGHLAPAEPAREREGLINIGMMLLPVPQPAAIVAAAGAWNLLAHPHALLEPADLARAFAARRGAAYFPAMLLRWLCRPQPFLPQLGWGGWSVGPAGGRGFVGFDTVSLVEQAPNPENRVTLGATRDRFGQPRPRIVWRWREADREALHRALDLFASELADAGLGYFRRYADHGPIVLSHHHMGTTRMHASPRQGVVDGDGRVHGLANLYIAGSSVFPTGGYANPTLTIVALALRLADQIRATFSRPTPALVVIEPEPAVALAPDLLPVMEGHPATTNGAVTGGKPAEVDVVS